ncbi:MAG: hypothetical protein LBH04_10725 [Tannerellaceae bacterium]|jgi:hypothetical protein|nr:hypothetical protein [Tannerellaceae bacterium]
MATFLLLGLTSSAQNISPEILSKTERWKKEIYSKYPSRRLSLDNLSKLDFSSFWVKEYQFGYIGTNYQRMYMTFKKVRKVSATEYHVSGFSSVKNNYCDFTGRFKIVELDQLTSRPPDGIAKEGYIFAEFIIDENPQQKSTGIFRGTLMTYWYTSQNGGVKFDYLGGEDHGYNNLFIGEWTSYNNGAVKPVGWGLGAIPLAEGILYEGDCEICISSKYYNNGWSDFEKCGSHSSR